MFSLHAKTNENPAFWNFEERFRKAPCSGRLSVDGRSNRRNKAGFFRFLWSSVDAASTLRFVRPHWSYFRLHFFHIATSLLHWNDTIRCNYITTIKYNIGITDTTSTFVMYTNAIKHWRKIMYWTLKGLELCAPVTHEIMRFTSSSKSYTKLLCFFSVEPRKNESEQMTIKFQPLRISVMKNVEVTEICPYTSDDRLLLKLIGSKEAKLIIKVFNCT